MSSFWNVANVAFDAAVWVGQNLGFVQQPPQEQPLVPRVQIASGDGFVIVDTPGELGVTESELEAQVVSISRDGNCLYGSMHVFLENNWDKFQGKTVGEEHVLNALPGLATLRTWVANYIEKEASSSADREDASASKCPLIEYLDATIHDYNEQVEADIKGQIDNLTAIAKVSPDQDTALQESYERVLIDAAEKKLGEGSEGYKGYARLVREDRFHGGYAEVYALSQIFGLRIKVLMEVGEGEECSRIASLIVDPEPQSACSLSCYLLFSPDEQHFDLLDYTSG